MKRRKNQHNKIKGDDDQGIEPKKDSFGEIPPFQLVSHGERVCRSEPMPPEFDTKGNDMNLEEYDYGIK